MPDQSELIKYYKNICDELNGNGYKIKPFDMDYEFDYNKPESMIFSVTCDINAYHYLESKGLIRPDLCHFCGEHPIDTGFFYTEPNNNIKINICKECHSKGRRLQAIYQGERNSGSGCLVMALGFAVISVSTYVVIKMV
jgi:hypothetical protein